MYNSEVKTNFVIFDNRGLDTNNPVWAKPDQSFGIVAKTVTYLSCGVDSMDKIDIIVSSMTSTCMVVERSMPLEAVKSSKFDYTSHAL